MKMLIQSAMFAAVIVALNLGATGCQTKDKNDKDKDKAAKDVAKVKIEVGGEMHKQITVGLGEGVWESIILKRPAGVTKDLTCSVRGGRDGVKGAVASAKINGDEINVSLTIEAAMDAKLGNVELTVIAESAGSPFASEIIPVLVRRRTSVSAVKPITVKQGQDGVAKATVTLGDDVKAGTLSFRVVHKDYQEAKGFTVKADRTELDKTTTEVTITVGVAETAAEGDYHVDMTVTTAPRPDHSSSYSKSFDLKVEKK